MSFRTLKGSQQPVLRAFAVLFCLVTGSAAVHAQVTPAHPRMVLDDATLATLRARAQADTPQWQVLQAWCDDVLPGVVYPAFTDTWASVPNIGSNYQGGGYIEATMNLGLCYQATRTTDPGRAAAYGAKLAEVLDVISDPGLFTPARAAARADGNPNHDAGYGIRNYAVAMGIGYDWGYDALSASLRQQVVAGANHWINAADDPNSRANYTKRTIHSNYYAGYFHAKAAVALGTWGDNAQAPAMLAQWKDDFDTITRPYFNQYMAGGGWPEGFANYGPKATLDMTLPVREYETATGRALVQPTDGAPAFAYPVEAAAYMMHFAWPDRSYFDDRDTVRRASDNVSAMYVTGLGILDHYGSPLAPVMHQYWNEVRQATNTNRPAEPWELFLFVDPNQASAPVAQLPRAYLAPGMGAVAARSNWSGSANWMSFRAGPYVNNFDHSEEYTDQGSLVLVNGSTPLLVNASGWLHNFSGNGDGDRIYSDLFGSFSHTQFKGNAQLFNVFYVRKLGSGGSIAERFGQYKVTPEPNPSWGMTAPRTGITAFVDTPAWMYTRASHLEDMYQIPYAGAPTVASWSREIVYLRPDRFVVLDRTRMRDAGDDQYLAFHFPSPPQTLAAPNGETRLGVTYQGHFAGTATFVYPEAPELETVELYPDSNPTHAWQVRVRPSGNNNREQLWLSVFDLVDNPDQAAAVRRIEVSQGNVLGVGLFGGADNQVVVTGKGGQGSRLETAFAYAVPAQLAHHLIVGLQPGSAWQLTADRAGDRINVKLQPGGTLQASAAGVLGFVIDATGTPQVGGTIFVNGFEQ